MSALSNLRIVLVLAWLTSTQLSCSEQTDSTKLRDGSQIDQQQAAGSLEGLFRSQSHFMGRAKTGRGYLPRSINPHPFTILSLGHSMASYQNYSSSPYFHHGLDLRGNAGDDVFTSVAGQVVNIENYVPGNSAYWEVAILDDSGFLWQYHHVDRRSIPQEIFDAYESGENIAAGSKLGEIYYWPVVTFGERFHHVHLNILDGDGNYLNPLSFLEPLNDTSAPEIVDIGILRNGRPITGDTVTGEYSLYIRVEDLVQHDRFVLPPYQTSYQLGNHGRVVWRFDRLPGGASNQAHVEELYVRSMVCGNYNCRRPVIDLGFNLEGESVFPSEPGEYRIEVETTDFAGQSTTRAYSWRVR